MSYSTRKSKQLDYKALNSTGEKIYKEHNTDKNTESSSNALHHQETTQLENLDKRYTSVLELSQLLNDCSLEDLSKDDSARHSGSALSMASSETISKLRIELSILLDDINDYIDENNITDSNFTIDDIDNSVKRVEELRTSYRSKHRELEHILGDKYETSFGKEFLLTISVIKLYIQEAKMKRNELREHQSSAVKDGEDSKKRSQNFQIEELTRSISELKDQICDNFTDLTDNEIIYRNKNLTEIIRRSDQLSEKFKHVLDSIKVYDTTTEAIISRVRQSYQQLLEHKQYYTFNLKKEVELRDLDKTYKNESKLNIKLPKFKGYDSSTDIYTFQSEFEKLHLRTTPKRLLPDLLKNNFLDEPAISIIRSEDDIDEIWKRLKQSYGNPKIMLSRKLADMTNLSQLSKLSNPEKVVQGLSKIINMMKDLIKLAKRHNIENKLYHGDAIVHIYNLMGDKRLTKWLTESSDDDLEESIMWNKLIDFLERDLRVHQEKMLVCGKIEETFNKRDNMTRERQSNNQRHSTHVANNFDHQQQQTSKCVLCGEYDHVATRGPNGTKLIQYFACKKFVELPPADRCQLIREKHLCMQCLYPGANENEPKHKEGRCQRDYSCRHPDHNKFPRKKHILLCHEHRNKPENIRLLEEYKRRYITWIGTTLPQFSQNIKLTFHSISSEVYQNQSDSDNEKSVYIMQRINVDDNKYNVFFDTGCGDLVCKYTAIQNLRHRAIQQTMGPIQLGGVGDIITESVHGTYQIKLPIYSGKDVHLTGVCLDNITAKFPEYPLRGEVQNDIHDAFLNQGMDVKRLPKLGKYVGGETDIMIGIKYLRYHPEKVFSLPSGLTIYRSVFQNSDGGFGVVGGPHHVFTEIEKHHNFLIDSQRTFFSQQFSLYRNCYQVNPDVSFLGFKPRNNLNSLPDNSSDDQQSDHLALISRKQKMFNEIEDAGSEISYRCVNCRSCKECTNHEHIEAVSIKEEIEQDLINKSVKLDLDNKFTIASLPLLHDPKIKLIPNKNNAMRVYNQQLKKLNRNPKDKEDVIKSERKLQDSGFVEYVKNLTENQQKTLTNSEVQNFIPWRAVWKDNSLSTPCRVVFDASQATSSGYSLNDILAKGKNNMNKLVEITIRWYSHKIAFHSDVQKMYNAVKLVERDWCLQRYLWKENLDADVLPEEKVIKTLIYGVKSSGNQAEHALRETANHSKGEYPEIAEIVNHDVYVDDCLSGSSSPESAFHYADQLEIVLNRGGFSLKGFTFSSKAPPSNLSEDGESVSVAGMRWYSESDKITLDISELNFSKKIRGRKPLQHNNTIPNKITRRHCASKVSEVYDITGKITPITATLKLDLRQLVKQQLDWDDKIPDTLRPMWNSHFEMIQEINSIKFKRAVIPGDAISLDVETIDAGDASKSLACAAIYVRYKRRNGEFSCQLIFARSKLIPENTSQPRAELLAAVLNTHTSEVVRRSLSKFHKSSIKLSDSQITLHWINSSNLPLKQWVRNRVIDIRRFSTLDQWYYVKSKDMIADIGTRRITNLDEVNQDSTWINGFDWMRRNITEFPISSIANVKLEGNDIQAASKESTPHLAFHSSKSSDIDNLRLRYQFSNYIIDPNRHRFRDVVRITALIFRFITTLKRRIQKHRGGLIQAKAVIKTSFMIKPAITLTDDELTKAENYFFKKCTSEVKNFLRKSQYDNISNEKNEILYYTGRILPTNQINAVGSMTKTMKDLTSTTFTVPILDKNSPVAYAILNEIHWYDNTAQHSGVETTHRFVMKKVFIIEGRDLVKKFNRSCKRCRYLKKKTIEVSMGPVSDYQLNIAPAFYVTQLDIAGPFNAYSSHNKRKTIKIWLVIFCCATTSTINIKVMDDYSTTSFIMAFIRFSCEVGYPKTLLPDAGSQLIKGCANMRLNYRDIQHQLHTNFKINYETCPVGGHHMHGKVERKIKEVKKSIDTSLNNQRLSILQWETLASQISNSMNNLPLALGNIVSDFETMDLITPNRLKLGRNNDRSPIGSLEITSRAERIIADNAEIFSAWFENWLVAHVPKLVHQPKWFKNDTDLKIGDIILFLKSEGKLSNDYQYGIVKSVGSSRDGRSRKATIRYRNANETTDRVTDRAVRNLIVIHHVDELDIMELVYNSNKFSQQVPGV